MITEIEVFFFHKEVRFNPNLTSPLQRQNLQQIILKFSKMKVSDLKKGFKCKKNNYEHSILNVPLDLARGRRN